MMTNETTKVISILVTGVADDQILELGSVDKVVYEDAGPISLEISSFPYGL